MQTTTVTKSGKSQVIRIPASLRLKSRTVKITATPAGLMVIDPARQRGLLKALRGLRGQPVPAK
jgi:virulence-associated protein VagC